MSPVTRGLSLFFGIFTLLNLTGDMRFARSNANDWWIDLRPLSLGSERLILFFAAIALLCYALKPAAATRFRWLTIPLLGLLAVAALSNSAAFYSAALRNAIHPAVPVPLSMFVAVMLLFIMAGHFSLPSQNRRLLWAAFLGAMVIFPLAQIGFFGTTDYRRSADLAVVFGARAFADGRPSDALADRVRTAAELYRSGLVKQLLFSGGPGEGRISEPAAMRRYAQKLGVPAEAIVEDRAGNNTEATVRNTMTFLHGQRPRVLVVSHFYHLPRIKMAYQRLGLETWTVPSHDSVPFSMFYNLPRESLAFWAYYLRRLT
jgi:vancomycin permeability regulator SanA